MLYPELRNESADRKGIVMGDPGHGRILVTIILVLILGALLR